MTGPGNGNPKDGGEESEETGLASVEERAGEPGPGDEPQESAASSAELAALRSQIESLRLEREDLKDQLLRRRADFENLRKRSDRDRQQAAFEATVAVLRDLIPALDNLERALGAAGDEASLRMGVELIHREVLSLLDSHGASAHDPTGQPFEPERHQALSHEVVPGFAEGTVVETFRKGYYFKDRLLRPALVKVAKDPEDQETAEPDGVH